MSDSPGWNWDSPRRQPADPSAPDSPWNSNLEQLSNPDNDSPWNEEYNNWDDFDEQSLTLAPIDPENTFDNLPPLEPGLFDAPSRLSTSSDDPFLSEPSILHNPPPPPSNQEARARREPFPPSPPRSQYFIADADSPDPFEIFSNLTPPPNMAPSTRNNTRSSSFVDLTASSPNQSRSDPPPSKKRKADSPGDGRPTKSSKLLPRPDEEVELVDLADVEGREAYDARRAQDLAETIKAQNQAEAAKPMKLAEFKCIICMDDPTDLTVTHCGHLFCSECLHQALHAGDRKCCPVCRTPIVVPRLGQKPTGKGYFPLSMKLTTAKKHGKRPVRA